MPSTGTVADRSLIIITGLGPMRERVMSVDFTSQVCVPSNVLVRKLDEESVLLNLDSEQYYGLDEVGTRMLDVLCESDSVEAAYGQLVDEYEVDPKTLRTDLAGLAEALVARGLLRVLG